MQHVYSAVSTKCRAVQQSSALLLAIVTLRGWTMDGIKVPSAVQEQEICSVVSVRGQ